MAGSVVSALSDIPRAVALPAVAASLAYLNAKLGVANDVWTISSSISVGLQMSRLEKQDRVNAFYVFERHATDPKAWSRLFLVTPADPAHPHQQTEWTYAEAYDTVLKYARWLQEVHGVQKNEIVAIDFTNKPQFLWLWFALWSLGAKPAFINSNLRSNAFVHCVRISTSRLLFLDPEIQHLLDDDETKLGLAADGRGRAVDAHILSPTLEQTILDLAPYRAPDSARAGDKLTTLAMLIYTSGTTGLPKAATVAWAKPHTGTLFCPKLLQLTPADRFLTAMPLYHSSASILGACAVLGAGCTLVLAPKFSPRTFMQTAAQTHATVVQYIGEMCRYLVASPPSPYDRAHTLRLAFGNGMRPDVWQKFKDRFAIPVVCELYGATEAPGASIVYERSGFLRGAIGRTGTLHRLLFGRAAVLVRHDHATDQPVRHPRTNLCVTCATNEPGELLYPLDAASIDEKFSGYFGNEKASSGKILRDVLRKGDVYYRTGDLQRMDADGRWWFLDRIGDTFRWKAENVSTAEVSQALGAHPAIGEANVYGVALPNHDGRAGCAAISLTPTSSAAGFAADAALRADLAAFVRKRLPKYAVPLFLRVVTEELEVTGTLKHQKVGLREAGVDPSRTGADAVFWLAPGAEAYEAFGPKEWEGIVAGRAKL
ncbi:hypothetical protein LTR36_002780 [Oleoguttula mirabilis]|uniref:Very long-chain fatty acid transport protein n=1 Tax=Oleoguttula mirabilis TaxID=1507867 RepID=A0AAV9JLP8_9PEZI|nr:hypothetical protein LTR36_002780 [Oleoguttula mirabilis]